MTRYPLIAVLMLSTCAHAEPFEIPVVPCDLLAGGCAEGVRTLSNGAWTQQGASPMIRTVANRSHGSPRARAVRTRNQPVSMELGPRTVTAAPGTTVLIEIAIGHLNRIVTPFDAPVIHTVSQASTQVDGSVVYVATDNEEPVALYIVDADDGAMALSLTLAPRYVPPREIRLSVPGYRRASTAPVVAVDGGGGGSIERSMLANANGLERGGAAQPYVAGIVALLRGMAQGRVPTGFKVQKGSGNVQARCIEGLKIRKTQLTVGPVARVLTAAIKNTSQRSIKIDQSACDTQTHVVAAVAAWPGNVLEPGQETELFMVLSEGEKMADPTGRSR